MFLTVAAGYSLIFKVAGVGLVAGLSDLLVQNEAAKVAIRVIATVVCIVLVGGLVMDGFDALHSFATRGW